MVQQTQCQFHWYVGLFQRQTHTYLIFIEVVIMQLPTLHEENWYPGGFNDIVPGGWAGELSYPNRTNFDDHLQQYINMIEWIKQNVADPYQNVLWTKIGDCIYIQFRQRKDMLWFTLRFGS